MTAPAPDITLDVDLRNPGQFFACCGVFEMAARMWPEKDVLGWFASHGPTSLVFGAWDSRDTEAKLPRLLASTIRAWDVEPLTRSAQYNPPLDYVGEALIADADDKKTLDAASALGFRHAPAAGTLGGVLVRGDIRREVILDIVALRALGPMGAGGDALRRYVLGLALVAMTYDLPHNLRQGCLLVRDPNKTPKWEAVGHDGTRTPFTPDHAAALTFATDAAKKFVVGKNEEVSFDRPSANKALREKKEGSKKASKAKTNKPSEPAGSAKPAPADKPSA